MEDWIGVIHNIFGESWTCWPNSILPTRHHYGTALCCSTDAQLDGKIQKMKSYDLMTQTWSSAWRPSCALVLPCSTDMTSPDTSRLIVWLWWHHPDKVQPELAGVFDVYICLYRKWIPKRSWVVHPRVKKPVLKAGAWLWKSKKQPLTYFQCTLHHHLTPFLRDVCISGSLALWLCTLISFCNHLIALFALWMLPHRARCPLHNPKKQNKKCGMEMAPERGSFAIQAVLHIAL